MVEREGISVEISANARDFVSGIGQALQALGGFRVASFAAAGAAGAMFTAQSFRAFAGYESNLLMVQQKTRMTTAESALLRAQVEAFGKTAAGSAFTNRDLAGALNAVAQGSRNAADSLAVVEAAAAFTTTRGGDLAANTELLNKTLEATGRDGARAFETMALLRSLSDEYGVSVENLAADLTATESRARIFGVTMEENAAIIAALAKNPSFDAKQMFIGLGQIDSFESDTNRKLITELGVSAFDTDRKTLRPLAETIADVNRRVATGAITNEEAGRRLIAVFGDRAGVALDTYRRSLGEVALANEVASRGTSQFAQDVEQSSASAANTISELDKAWQDFKSSFGENVAPVIVPALEFSADALNAEGDTSATAGLQWYADRFSDFFGAVGTALGEMFASLVNDLARGFARFFGAIGNGFQRAASIVGGWVDGAKNWLVALPGNLISGVSDLGARVWGAISAGLNWVQTQFDNWRASHPWFDRFVGSIGNIASSFSAAPAAPSVAAPSVAAPAVAPINIENLSLPGVTDAASFTRELSALTRRDEFTANYQTLSQRRGNQ